MQSAQQASNVGHLCGMLAAGPGLEVWEHRRPAQGDAAGPPEPLRMQHTIFLTGVFADTPARDKITKWAGVGAYLSCGFCLFQATRCAVLTCMNPKPHTPKRLSVRQQSNHI